MPICFSAKIFRFILLIIGFGLFSCSCTSKKMIQEASGAYVTVDGTYDGLSHIQKDFSGAVQTEGGVLLTFDSDVSFALNSAQLSAQAKNELDKLIALLKERPEVRFVVDGHTDATGPVAFNQTLSENRALAVKAHLVSKGIKADRIKANGYGSTKPIASNQSTAGRLKNRRVEIRILD